MFGKTEQPPKLSKKELKELEKQQKQAQKEHALLEKYGVENLHNPQDIESVKRIATSMAGDGFFDLGSALGGANEKDYLRRLYDLAKVQMEQNFILIRQLDELNSKLK